MISFLIELLLDMEKCACAWLGGEIDVVLLAGWVVVQFSVAKAWMDGRTRGWLPMMMWFLFFRSGAGHIVWQTQFSPRDRLRFGLGVLLICIVIWHPLVHTRLASRLSLSSTCS